jgi:enolase
MSKIVRVDALEILDSRGDPTVQVEVTLADGAVGVAGVPAGASTGQHEARELRDADPERYSGRGVLGAVVNVRDAVNQTLTGRRLARFEDILEADRLVHDLDGTEDFGRIGANVAVGTSMACAQALAVSAGLPLWKLLHEHESAPGWEPRLPVPHFNVVNGGAHASNPLGFQEFMIAPVGSPSFSEAVRAGVEIYTELRRWASARDMKTGVGDEGGLALPLVDPADVLRLLVEAIESAGYRAGRDGVAIALDPAANGFREPGGYRVGREVFSSGELVAWYGEMTREYPIWSIEDGLAEDDLDGWREMTNALSGTAQIVGDDIFVTDAERVKHAEASGIANACLIKPNQAGNLTRTLRAVDVCRAEGYGVMVSHRSGETSDTFIADLSVGIGCGQLKSGAPTRGERVAKYNRLLAIEHKNHLPYGLRGADARH